MTATGRPATADAMPRRLVLVMAVATGLAVANNYYAQPLLATIAREFHVSSGRAGLLVTVAQVGYVVGLLALVPLGDLIERRRLVTGVLCLSVVALAGAAMSPSLGALAIASLLVGLTSVVAQIIVPFAASLAADHERGAVVGTVMSGLLIGVLLARTVAGVVADAFGWRSIYLVAAVLMVGLIVMLHRELPVYRERGAPHYRALLGSVWHLVRTERVLRYRAVYGAAMFATFSVFWTTAAFLLSKPPYGYSDRTIGAFGLLGVAGAIAASVAGRLADRGWARSQTAVFLATALLAWIPLAIGAHHLAALVVGIIAMDLGAQGTHITNQSEIYRLDAAARSRITTAYMTAYFIGGAAGSLSGAFAFDAAGWDGVCVAGASFVAVGLATWVVERRGQHAKSRTSQPEPSR